MLGFSGVSCLFRKEAFFCPPYYLFGKMFPPILRVNLPLLSVNGKTNLIIIFMLIPRTCCCCCCWSVFVLFMVLLIRQRARGIRLSSDGRRCGLQFDGGDFATWRRLVHWWMFGSKLAWTLLAVFDLVCEKFSPEMEKFSRNTQKYQNNIFWVFWNDAPENNNLHCIYNSEGDCE